MEPVKVFQIMVGGHRIGIIDLKQTLEAVAAESSGKSDREIADDLLARLEKKNYITPKAVDAYRTAFLREYKKHVGQPFADSGNADVLQVRVLGPGCPSCERLERDLMGVMAEERIQADFEHVRDPLEIGTYGVAAMPAVVINGTVKSAGRMPSKESLKTWLLEALRG